jgi:hypothetical protein
LRQAQEEAAAELASYRAQREEQFKRLVASVRARRAAPLPHARAPSAPSLTRRAAAQQTGDSGTTVKQLEADSVRLNAAMAQSVATQKAAVRAAHKCCAPLCARTPPGALPAAPR